MKIQLRFILLFIGLIASLISSGVYLENYPIKVNQPNGKELSIFLTGDEFYNWMHDENGYTIIPEKKSGYYCYATLENENLVASKYIVGEIAPEKAGLSPNINISPEELQSKMNKILESLSEEETEIPEKINTKSAKIMQTLNNIVVYIRFADQAEFPANQAYYTSIYNNTSIGALSMRNYFREVSYNQLDISSTFYPTNNGTNIISYQDCHIRDYYRDYYYSDSGYVSSSESLARERDLVQRTLNFAKSQIDTSSINFDFYADGTVANVCFVVKGEISGRILWPHASILPSSFNLYLRGKKVSSYNFQIESGLLSSHKTLHLCHEMFHTIHPLNNYSRAKDLYRNDSSTFYHPVGVWDIMGGTNIVNPPQHMGAYMKYRHGGWISNIPEITSSGTYTLNPLTSPTNNCYKIPISSSIDGKQYFVLEYRKKTSTGFESNLPNNGLIIYRIDESLANWGNLYGRGHGGLIMDEVYIFRKDGSPTSDGDITNAYLSSNVNRTQFYNSSNPYCFIAPSPGYLGNVYITNISEAGSTISFDIRFCDGDDVIFSNISSLPELNNASNSISTSGTVVVQNGDNVTFEAGNEIILNPGFEIQSGGIFVAKIGQCGNP